MTPLAVATPLVWRKGTRGNANEEIEGLSAANCVNPTVNMEYFSGGLGHPIGEKDARGLRGRDRIIEIPCQGRSLVPERPQ